MNASRLQDIHCFDFDGWVAALYPALLQPELRATMRFADLSLILHTGFMPKAVSRFIRSRSYLS